MLLRQGYKHSLVGADLPNLATSASHASTFQPHHEAAQHSTSNHPLAQFPKGSVRRVNFVTVARPFLAEAPEFVYSALDEGQSFG